MKKTIDTLDKKHCSGCAGCMNVCPTNAIKMQEDKEGFLMPVINVELCVKCGMCYKQCPVIHTDYSNDTSPQLFAVRASDEIRAVSSSGGMFTVIAEYVLQLGGIVCGAAYDKNMILKHIIVDKKEDLHQLRGSKYVQSNVGYIYREIKEYLEKETKVLFTGTPCQVASLKKYLKKEYKTLITIDLLCHGVPSQKNFSKYLKEKFQNKEITDVRFRDKRFGWTAEHILVEFSNGEAYHEISKKDPYLKAFLRNLSLRNSCGDCPFSEFPRQGDITLGDFWGISRVDKTQTDGKGTSLVYINSERGKNIFNEISSEIQCKEFPFAKTEIKNRIHSDFPINKNRNRFHKFLENDRINFEKAVNNALNDRYDIGIVSNYYAGNFGGSLTQYALYHTLEDMGYSCLMIERPENATGKASLETMKKIYIEIPYNETALTEQRANKEQMRELNEYCDSFVVGSDQLFQYSLYNALGRFVALDWVDNGKKKIAYAASYGHDYIWGEKEVLAEMSFFMKMFDAFSVREKSGVEISKNYFGVEAEWVLDPVFLCDVGHYEKLIKKSQRVLPKKYIASYILDPSNQRAEILKYAEKELNMKAKIFSEFNHSEEYVLPLKDLEIEQLRVEERLQLIKECEFFVTDSFHGTCFAIIMKKNFISILNSKRGGSRFESLLSMFGLEHRLVRNINDLKNRSDIFEPIDYDAVYRILDKEKQRCMNWLQNALTKPKEVVYSAYDVLIKKIEEQSKEIKELRSLVEKMQIIKGGYLSTIAEIIPYLSYLLEHKEEYIVIVSVKDTSGLALSKEVAESFMKLGFKTNLENKHWNSYIGIMNAGTVVHEKISSEPLKFVGNVEGLEMNVISKTYKKGNLSVNEVNGIDYSVNKRGLNITVIEKTSKKIVDSVCFDLHLRKYAYFRK